MNLIDFVNNKRCKNLWLCPNLISNQTLDTPYYMHALECSNVPEEIKNKEVMKAWNEDNMLCIIWRNE